MKRMTRAMFLAAFAGASVTPAIADQLTTLFATNNNGSPGGAVYYDIVTGPNPITITAFDTNTASTGPFTLTVYTVSGGYTGHTGSQADWTNVSSGSGTGAGTNSPSHAEVTPFVLPANSTVGIALVMDPATPHYYTNGDGTNQTYFDANMTINLGAASNVPFDGAPFSPRVWNGTIYYQVGGTPPTTGACCLPGFTCQVRTQANCTAGGGVYAGDNVTCANANCPQPPQFTFATNLAGTFVDISATGSDITSGDDSSVAFTSGATNDLVTTANLFACTNGFITSSVMTTYTNGSLPVSGISQGLFPLWDDLYVDLTLGGSLRHQLDSGVEIVQWNNVRLFGTTGPTGTFEVKIFPLNAPGPGGARAQFLYQSVGFANNGGSATIGYQQSATLANTFSQDQPSVSDGMVVSIVPVNQPPSCYANCDHSTTNPFLNVLDFNCFLNQFSAGASYANCDGSTIQPVLNVLDFNCFLNRFSAGCSAP